MKKFLLLLFMAWTLPGLAQTTLWYNGDLVDGGGINSIGGAGIDARVFDSFQVTDPTGWLVSNIWSNNFSGNNDYFISNSADWSIRTGMSAGNGGTIVASGISQATKTPTGRRLNQTDNFGTLFYEYKSEVSGLNITLLPGTYWLQVSPIVEDTTSSVFNSRSTGGQNFFGPASPSPGIMDVPSRGINYERAADEYSMGVAGSVIPASAPEPSSLALLLPALIPLGLAIRRMK